MVVQLPHLLIEEQSRCKMRIHDTRKTIIEYVWQKCFIRITEDHLGLETDLMVVQTFLEAFQNKRGTEIGFLQHTADPAVLVV